MYKLNFGFIITTIVAFFILSLSSIAQEKSGLKQITFDKSQEGFPSWAPDGKFLIYSFVSKDVTLNGLRKYDFSDGEIIRLTTEIGEHPDWSENGNFIVFDADSGNSIKLMNLTFGSIERLFPEGKKIKHGGLPNCSPDNNFVVFLDSENMSLVKINIQTKEETVLFRREGKLPLPGCWSKSDNKIYFTLKDKKTGESDIWRITPDGIELTKITKSKHKKHRYLDVSLDGKYIVYAAVEDNNLDLWITYAEGGNPIRLTNNENYDDTPRWSPDGKSVAFTSTRSGNFDVWIIDVDLQNIENKLKELNR